MVLSCVAYGCTQRFNKISNPSITFHRFPKDESLKKEWVLALKRENFSPSDHTRLCSKHFREEDFYRTVKQKRLHSEAVPSLFEAFPAHLRCPKTQNRKAPKDRPVSDNTMCEIQCPATTSGADIVKLKRKLTDTQDKLSSSKKKIKILQQSKRRLVKKNSNLCNVISELKRKSFMCDESLVVLENCATGVSDLLRRQIAKHNDQSKEVRYSPALRSFALTLHFYSPRAYRYVRKMFDTCLPHPRTIAKWYHQVEGKPGFTNYSFAALKTKVAAAHKKGKSIVCSLIKDDIAIKQQIEWDGKKYHGHIDMGTELDDDRLPVAKEALVFMDNAVNDSWKLPVGYFLIAGLGAQERANLLQQCLDMLHSVGATVISVTFDGSATNISMVKEFGCYFDYEDMKNVFPHPVTQEPVSIFLDPCHMIKLVRNAFGDKKHLLDGDGNTIRWEYIEKLHDLQVSEGLHLGNRLKYDHVAWIKKKMNVKLAAQLLSESVAKSLQFCLDKNIEGFQGCDATIKFLTIFNILNSRNLCARDYKCPMQRKNAPFIKDFLQKAERYIRQLMLSNGTWILNLNRRTGFQGFIVCIRSLSTLYENLIECSEPKLKFLMTYKMSQDHIELFFGKIRSMGGCNNNPTSRQFSAAYKKILIHNDVQDVLRGNCIPLDSVPILNCSSSISYSYNSTVRAINNSSVRNNLILCDQNALHPEESIENENDYIYIPSSRHLSLCSNSIVAYIAGFVVFKFKKSLCCATCIDTITNTDNIEVHHLIHVKSKGYLIHPSDDVVEICVCCEKMFRKSMCFYENSDISKGRRHFQKIISSVLEYFQDKTIFSNVADHMFESEPCKNHIILLIKAISERYLQVRYSYAAKHFSASLQAQNKMKSRQTYTKLIHFSGQ